MRKGKLRVSIKWWALVGAFFVEIFQATNAYAVTEINQASCDISAGGSYILMEDITLSGNFMVGSNTDLDLNGINFYFVTGGYYAL